MRSQISEFSYGYALTEKLVNRTGNLIGAAPLFPSLREEGKAGNGYDVKIDFGIPVFIQFKLSECLNTRGAKEIKKYKLTPPLELPIYRMKLRARKYSNQHDSLLALEEKGNAVYYAAPIFHKSEELNELYLKDKIIEKTVFIQPSQIGEIDDDKEHDVSFSPSLSYGYRLSQPRIINNLMDSERFVTAIERKISESSIRFDPNFNAEIFLGLTEQILSTVPTEYNDELDSYRRSWMRNMEPLEKLSFATQAFLGSQLLFIGHNADR